MTEIISKKMFERVKIEYRIYVIGAIFFSSIIGFAIGLKYNSCP